MSTPGVILAHQMARHWIVGICLSLMASVGGSAWAQTVRPADPLRGGVLYQALCLDCHGSAEAPVNSTSLNARNLSAVLVEGMANPRSGMLFLRDALSEADIADIVAHLGQLPGSIAFPDEPVGVHTGASVRSLAVRAGREPLTRLQVAVQGDFQRVGGSCGDTVAAQTACTVDLQFKPSGPGARVGAVLLTHDGVPAGVRVVLSGQGIDRPRGTPVWPAASLDFGSSTVLAAPLQRVLILTNTGNAALTLAMLRVEGAHAADFTIDPSASSCALGGVVAVGATCSLAIGFRPSAAGERNATVVAQGGDASEAVGLRLTGLGQTRAAPVASADPMSLDFGRWTIGSSSTPRTLELINRGSQDLVLLSIVPPVGVQVASSCLRTLAPGESCRLSLVFSPTTEQVLASDLVVQSNAEGSLRIPLSGLGSRSLPRLQWSDSGGTVSFGSTPLGRAILNSSLELVNAGDEPARIDGWVIQGAQAGDFLVDAGSSCRPGLLLSPGERCRLTLSFLPDAVGSREALLSVRSSTAEVPSDRTLRASAVLAGPVATTNLGGGGCTVGAGDPRLDPLLAAMAVLALGIALHRRRQCRSPHHRKQP